MYAGYSRVSRVGERDERLRSPEFQAERIKSAARRAGVEVELLPPELDVSGAKEQRAILDGAIDRIERGELEGLVVAQFDRLSRLSMARALALLERIERAGGRVISDAEPLDPSTPEGQFTRNTFLNAANFERNRKAAGFATAKEAAVARGAWTAPRVPLGYVKPGRGAGLVVDPETSSLVAEVFRRRAAGASWWELTGYLSEALGRPVDGKTVQNMVRNRAYLGEVRQGQYVNAQAHEPIIDRATWEAAQIWQGRTTQRRSPLLSGLMRCAACGHMMVGNTHGTSDKKQRSYVCSWRRHCPAPVSITARVEDAVVARVLPVLAVETAEAQRSSVALDTALADLALAEGRYTDAKRPEVQDALGPDWLPLLRERRADVDAAAQRVGQLRARAPRVPELPGLVEMFPELEPEEQRTILKGAIGCVWVRKGPGSPAERIRIVAPGYGPDRADGCAPLDWESNLNGELGMAPGKDASPSTGSTITGAIDG